MRVSRVRALVRRAFPYLAIAVAGFAVAYVIVFVFVLPSSIVPSRAPKVPDQPGHDRLPPLEPLPPDSLAAAPAESVLPPPMSLSLPPESTTPVELPNVSGMMASDARTVLEGFRIRVTTQLDTSSFQPENTVLRQIPAAGTQVAPGSTVALIVSRFPPRANSPEVPPPSSTPPVAPQSEPRPAEPAPTPPARNDTAPHDSTPSDSTTTDSTGQ